MNDVLIEVVKALILIMVFLLWELHKDDDRGWFADEIADFRFSDGYTVMIHTVVDSELKTFKHGTL